MRTSRLEMLDMHERDAPVRAGRFVRLPRFSLSSVLVQPPRGSRVFQFVPQFEQDDESGLGRQSSEALPGAVFRDFLSEVGSREPVKHIVAPSDETVRFDVETFDGASHERAEMATTVFPTNQLEDLLPEVSVRGGANRLDMRVDLADLGERALERDIFVSAFALARCANLP